MSSLRPKRSWDNSRTHELPVDYYLLHTGYTEWEFFSNPKPDAPSFRYLRLTQPIDILTCIRCYANAQIRQRLKAAHQLLPEENKPAEPSAKG